MNKKYLSLKETRIKKKDIINKLLDKQYTNEEIKELMDLLINKKIDINIDKEIDKNITKRDKLSDRLTLIAGSWTFIIGFCIFLLLWMVLNYFYIIKIDKFPFILLNLMLSCLAALQAPIIMMSQNRQANKDSIRNQNDYQTDLKSELLLEEIYYKLDKIIEKLNNDK